MTRLHRKDSGRPIRDAMREAGLSGPKLAEATRTVDPEGKGVSPAVVGHMAGTGATARERFRLRTAWLVADALGKPLQSLFSMPIGSTSTLERSRCEREEPPRGSGAAAAAQAEGD